VCTTSSTSSPSRGKEFAATPTPEAEEEGKDFSYLSPPLLVLLLAKTLLLLLFLLLGSGAEGITDDDDDKEVLNIIISSLNCNESDPQKSPLKTINTTNNIKMSGVTALRRLAQRSIRTTNATFKQQPQQKRLFASDPNAPPKVNYPWQDPTNPGNWKEEHLVFVILGGWGVVIMGGKAALS